MNQLTYADEPVFIDVKTIPKSTNASTNVNKCQIVLEHFDDDKPLVDISEVSHDKEEKLDVDDLLVAKVCNIQKRNHHCPECQKYSADTEEKVQRHIRKVHRGENPFQCYMCDYSAYNKCRFEEHIHVHQGIKPYKCSHCPYRSASKKNTKKHEQRHNPENPLRCDECDFVARNNMMFMKHKRMNHSKSDFKIYKCKWNQSLCTYVTPFVAEYKAHIKKHKKQCPVCDAIFSNEAAMREHLSVIHNNGSESKKHNNTRAKFQCQLCPWMSTIQTKILLHLIHHPNQKIPESIDTSILKKHDIIV